MATGQASQPPAQSALVQGPLMASVMQTMCSAGLAASSLPGREPQDPGGRSGRGIDTPTGVAPAQRSQCRPALPRTCWLMSLPAGGPPLGQARCAACGPGRERGQTPAPHPPGPRGLAHASWEQREQTCLSVGAEGGPGRMGAFWDPTCRAFQGPHPGPTQRPRPGFLPALATQPSATAEPASRAQAPTCPRGSPSVAAGWAAEDKTPMAPCPQFSGG